MNRTKRPRLNNSFSITIQLSFVCKFYHVQTDKNNVSPKLMNICKLCIQRKKQKLKQEMNKWVYLSCHRATTSDHFRWFVRGKKEQTIFRNNLIKVACFDSVLKEFHFNTSSSINDF